PDAAGADQLLVLTGAGAALVRAADVTVTAQPVVDETRRLATVPADAVPTEAVLEYAHPAAPAAICCRAEVAVACDSLGIAEQMLS
ncbi:acyl-CoA dehydrogenase, partial [Mycobacterium sp. ITM-2017-0098]